MLSTAYSPHAHAAKRVGVWGEFGGTSWNVSGPGHPRALQRQVSQANRRKKPSNKHEGHRRSHKHPKYLSDSLTPNRLEPVQVCQTKISKSKCSYIGECSPRSRDSNRKACGRLGDCNVVVDRGMEESRIAMEWQCKAVNGSKLVKCAHTRSIIFNHATHTHCTITLSHFVVNDTRTQESCSAGSSHNI